MDDKRRKNISILIACLLSAGVLSFWVGRHPGNSSSLPGNSSSPDQPIKLRPLKPAQPTVPPPGEVQRKKLEKPAEKEGSGIVLTAAEGSPPLMIQKLADTHFLIDIPPRRLEGKKQDRDKRWFACRIAGAAGRVVRIDFKNMGENRWASVNPLWAAAESLEETVEIEGRGSGIAEAAFGRPPIPSPPPWPTTATFCPTRLKRIGIISLMSGPIP